MSLTNRKYSYDYSKLERAQSKFLSYVLRHHPESIGITLDKNGWISTYHLLKATDKHKPNLKLNMVSLRHIVETNDKQRFTFSENGNMIRANQGHSLSVELDLKAVKPPVSLYHGTAKKFMLTIKYEGLKKQSRHHVHLSKDGHDAYKVACRHGSPFMLLIETERMYEDGYEFFKSKNGVWLTDHVPLEYIRCGDGMYYWTPIDKFYKAQLYEKSLTNS